MRLLRYILVDPLRTLTVLFWASLNSTLCETQNKLDFMFEYVRERQQHIGKEVGVKVDAIRTFVKSTCYVVCYKRNFEDRAFGEIHTAKCRADWLQVFLH